jgi:hypothetical protein
MPKVLFKAPENLVSEWPEIFNDMWISTMPVTYLNSLHFEFEDGQVWEFNIKKTARVDDAEILSKRIRDLIVEHYKTIKKIDFQIDIERLKQDITTLTDKVL